MNTDTKHKWWQDTLAYEIYVRSFKDSNGDGIGDLKGIIEKLDYLEQLNVGAIWLTPVYSSPMVDGGYDVADYYSIDPLFGNMEDMQELIVQADRHHIKVVMDLVVNHTSNQCEWFQQSCQSKDNKYSDFYIWKDAKEGGFPPNNWRSIFGGSAWSWCDQRKQYYLHTFASAQPDLNWANPKVRQSMIDIANYWIEKGVQGFRVDAIPYIKKPEDFSSGKPDNADGLVSIHDATANQEGILDYLKEFNESLINREDIFTVGEANGVEAKQLNQWVGNDGVFDMLFEFSHINLEFKGAEVWCQAKEWNLLDLKKALNDSQQATKENGWVPIFFENHDKPRSVNHYFKDDCDLNLCAKTMATLLMTLRGTPFIYQGEEIGMSNTTWTLGESDDVNVHGQYEIALQNHFSKEEALNFVNQYSRDNARTPMQWNNEINAGFSTSVPWIHLNDNYLFVNVESEKENPDSVLNWYKKLSQLRKESEILKNGNYQSILNEHPQIIAYIRNYENQSMLILNNMTNKEAEFDISILKGYSLLLTSSKKITDTLAPLESRIYMKQ